MFLRDVFGGDEALAEAVNRLLVVGFYLLTLGFVVLAMRPSADITSVRQAAGVLSVKVGEVLLVLGALHLTNVLIFRRIRRPRRRPWLGRPGAGRRPPRSSGSAHRWTPRRATPRTYIDHCGRA